jgi:hypothetical protein
MVLAWNFFEPPCSLYIIILNKILMLATGAIDL